MTARSVHGHLWSLTLWSIYLPLVMMEQYLLITSARIQFPDFFCFDLSLILLSLLMRAPDCHTNLTAQHVKDQMAGFLKWVQGPFQVNHTRTTAKDQQRLRIYRTRNSEAIGLITNPNPSVGFNKQPR